MSNDFFFIKSERKYIKINNADIKFITGLKDYCIINTINGKYSTAMNIKTIYSQLDENSFIRVNKSYIINVGHILHIEKDIVFIADEQIPIGLNYKPSFMDFINSKLLKR